MTPDNSATSSEGEPRAAYVEAVLREWRRFPNARPSARQAFLHLGHFENPDTSASREDFVRAQERLSERLLEWLGPQDGERVLEVGAGFGATLQLLGERLPAAKLVGLERDPRQLSVARELDAHRRVRWVEGDACRLPFADASFERVLAVECAFHFASRARFLSEAARVLSPGGRLVSSDFVATPAARLAAADATWPAHALVARLEAGFAPYPDPFWSEGEPEALASAAGLRLRRRENAAPHAVASFRCLLAADTSDLPSELAAVNRALGALAWLHEHDFLRMEYHVYERA